MSGAVAGLIGSLKAAVASVLNKYFFLFAQATTAGDRATSDLYSMQSDSSGNLYGINANYEIISVAKDGTLRWIKSFTSTTGIGNIIPYKVFTVDNAIYVGGYMAPDGNGRGVILKLDTTGAIVWSKVYNSGMISQVTSFGVATNGDILFTGSLYVYQTGYFESVYRLNPSTGALISYHSPTLTYETNLFPVQSSTGIIYSLLPNASRITSNAGTKPIKIDHSTLTSGAESTSSGMVIDSSDFLYLTIGYTNGTALGVGVVKVNPVTRAVVWSKILSSSATTLGTRNFSAGSSICIDSTNTYIYVFVGNCIAKLDLSGNIVSGWLRTMTVSSQTFNTLPMINITSDSDLIISNQFGAMKIRSDDTLSGVTTYAASFRTMTYQTTTQYSSTFVPTIYDASSASDPSGVTTISSPSTYINATYSGITTTTVSKTLSTGNRYIYA
jgi:hypothetical protein